MLDKKKILFLGLFALTLAILSGCGGMVKTTRVVDGKKVTTWADPETAKRMEEEEKQRAAYIEELRKAEKRKATDPIIVALFETDVADKLKKSTDGRLFPQFRKEFENDPIIRLVDQKIVNKAAKQASREHSMFEEKPKVAADVSVFSYANIKETVGYSKKTKKTGKMIALVYTATVSSHYFSEDTCQVKETGNILKNVEVTKKFADKIKDAIKNKIGPNIPSAAAKQEIEEKQKSQFLDLLKSLKKKK
ncbi:MAG: hypothetical protein ACETVT_03025 [bacterium]